MTDTQIADTQITTTTTCHGAVTAGSALLRSLRLRRVDDATRFIGSVLLTHEQAADLGDDTLDWARQRLGLHISVDDDGVTLCAC